jgi:membrane protease YdiL (CAAX protease family)
MYIINFFIQIFLINLAPIVTGVDLYTINDAGEKIFTPQNEDFINSWTQILVYTILAIGLIIINFNFLLEDINDFKNNFKKLILQVPIGFGIFYGVSFFCNVLMTILKINESSANQNALEQIVNGKYSLLVLFAIVIIGPICEELIFRQSAFRIFKRGTKALTKIILTGVIFGSIHVVSAIIMYFLEGNFSAIPKEFILGIPYILQGIALSYVYHSSNENIIPVTIVHTSNNLIAAILLLISQ